MKKYIKPIMEGQMFVANEYVAACITGTIQCAYPGNGRTNGKLIYDDYNGQSSGWYTDREGHLHGLCGYDAIISFNGNTASGYESNNGVTDKDRPIFNISGYEEVTGEYNVTWSSTNKDDNITYNHRGRLIVTNVDDTHPNHS